MITRSSIAVFCFPPPFGGPPRVGDRHLRVSDNSFLVITPAHHVIVPHTRYFVSSSSRAKPRYVEFFFYGKVESILYVYKIATSSSTSATDVIFPNEVKCHIVHPYFLYRRGINAIESMEGIM